MGGDVDVGGKVGVRFLHGCPMSLAICGTSQYCQAKVAQLWSSLNKARGIAFLWRYGFPVPC